MKNTYTTLIAAVAGLHLAAFGGYVALSPDAQASPRDNHAIEIGLSTTDDYLTPGDTMDVSISLENLTANEETLDLYIALDLGGQLLFFPNFTDTPEAYVPGLAWPGGTQFGPFEFFRLPIFTTAGTDTPMTWIAAAFDSNTGDVISNIPTLTHTWAGANVPTPTPSMATPTPLPAGLSCQGNTCFVSGDLLEDVTFEADKEYILRGRVRVGNGDEQNPIDVTLTIEPGTVIKGERRSRGYLVIQRGSQIIADGRADAPIVFTSDQPVGSRRRADWGGLVINGYAPLNTGTEAVGEGETGVYGGTDPMDSSGILRYVRVEYGGRFITVDDELNGIAFQGVGAGTTVEYVQSHMGEDDGIEFFGGTVNAKYLLITGAADDSLDWTDGWQGKGQYIVIQQHDDDSDNGIEADNNGEDNDATPRSAPQLANLTIVGDPVSASSDTGMVLREGTSANIWNAIVTTFNASLIDIDQQATFDNAYSSFMPPVLTGNLTVENSIFWNDTRDIGSDTGESVDEEDFLFVHNVNNSNEDPMLTDPLNLTAPNFAPMAGSPALSGAATLPNDGFFDQVSFRGAVDPNNDWTQGWTTYALN